MLLKFVTAPHEIMMDETRAGRRPFNRSYKAIQMIGGCKKIAEKQALTS